MTCFVSFNTLFSFRLIFYSLIIFQCWWQIKHPGRLSVATRKMPPSWPTEREADPLPVLGKVKHGLFLLQKNIFFSHSEQGHFLIITSSLFVEVGKVVQVPASRPHPGILWREDRHLLCMARWANPVQILKSPSKDFTLAGCFPLLPWVFSFSFTASSLSTKMSALRRCAVKRQKSGCSWLILPLQSNFFCPLLCSLQV